MAWILIGGIGLSVLSVSLLLALAATGSGPAGRLRHHHRGR